MTVEFIYGLIKSKRIRWIKSLNCKLEVGIAEKNMKQDGIVIMLHQIKPQISNLT